MKTKIRYYFAGIIAILFVALAVMDILTVQPFAKSKAEYIDNAENVESMNQVSIDDTVISYKSVFDFYYDNLVKEMLVNDKHNICTRQEFIDGYYESGLTIVDYTNALKNDNVKASAALLSSSSEDADYILKNIVDYNTTPQSVFKRTPIQSAFDYSTIQDGDIIIETATIIFNVGHAAFIYDADKPREGGSTYCQTIEAVKSGVKYGFLDDDRMVKYGAVIMRSSMITNNYVGNEEIQSAREFIFAQLGKTYDFNPERANTSITSSKWYCSELVNAACQFIHGTYTNSQGGCMPIDLYSKTYFFPLGISGYLDINLIKKEGNKWTIRVYNG